MFTTYEQAYCVWAFSMNYIHIYPFEYMYVCEFQLFVSYA